MSQSFSCLAVGTPKDFLVENCIDLSKQVSSETSSQIKKADKKSSVAKSKKGETNEEAEVNLPDKKSGEPECESLPNWNTSVQTEWTVSDKRQKETHQVTISQTEKVPDISTEHQDDQ